MHRAYMALVVTGLAAAPLLTVGCGTVDRGFSAARPSETVLRVKNHNWLDAKIYLLEGSSRIRVGTVMGMASQATITLPASFVRSHGSTVLLVELIGSRARYISPRLIVNPGEVVELEIQNNLALTSVSVW